LKAVAINQSFRRKTTRAAVISGWLTRATREYRISKNSVIVVDGVRSSEAKDSRRRIPHFFHRSANNALLWLY